ncbi:HAMP domain-containing sensor histidine kinase [Terrabacter carboxydivorans]|uniref:histidine kinase n=1 Tax=Terrabacter carboxydivorans TaxID=619730 RepID=A0ABN3L8P6_9MICO
MIAEAALLAAVAAVAVGAVGALVVRALAVRSLVAAAVVAPVVVILSVAVGVVVTARAMFISDHDQAVTLVVTATSLPIAAVFGWLIARRVQELMRASAQEAAQRDRDRQVEQSRRELVAWVSHDLRTPLAGIRAMAEALEDGHAPADGSYPARIRSEADRMSDMVGGLLALSRLQSGTLRLDRAPVDIGDLVSDAVASARVLADRRGVQVTGSAPPRAVTASADVGELSRALSNLVTNALTHTPAGGTVDISLTAGRTHSGRDDVAAGTGRSEVDGPGPRHENGEDGGDDESDRVARVTVADACGGIPEDELDRLFEPGWRGTRARTPAAGVGAGLGLAVARGIARAHGGDVTVANTGPGCRFELTLPLLEAGPDHRP